MPNVNVLIVGAGAIGRILGAFLDKAGASVSFVCRSNYQVVKEQGVEVESPLGNYSFTPKQVVDDVHDFQGDLDYLLIATKALPEISYDSFIAPVAHKSPAIILVQNGIDVETSIKESFPTLVLISGLVFIYAKKEGDNKVLHQDSGRLVLGDYPSGVSEETKKLAALFDLSDFQATTSDSIIEHRWKKLVWNASFNPLSITSGGKTTTELIDSESDRNKLESIMKEVLLVARSENVDIPESFIQKTISNTSRLMPYKTSMLQDYEAGKSLEIEAILGQVIKKANEKNISIPTIQKMYEELKKG